MHILCIPESVPVKDLFHIFKQEVPEALSIPHKFKVDIAQRTGPDLCPTGDKKHYDTSYSWVIPWLVIQFLDYTDNMAISRSFKHMKNTVQVRGHKVRIFRDSPQRLQVKEGPLLQSAQICLENRKYLLHTTQLL